MQTKDYVNDALRTELDAEQFSKSAQLLNDPNIVRLLHAAMGMTTEVGELMDALKRHIFYGKPLDFVNLAEEAGDNAWYWAILVDVVEKMSGITADEVLQRNIAKLKARYPDKFNSQDALNRNLDTE